MASNCRLPRDKRASRLHALSVRWVLAAVMCGEARAVVVMGRVEVSERVGRAETVEKRAEALRVESERAFPEVGGLTECTDKWTGLLADPVQADKWTDLLLRVVDKRTDLLLRVASGGVHRQVVDKRTDLLLRVASGGGATGGQTF